MLFSITPNPLAVTCCRAVCVLTLFLFLFQCDRLDPNGSPVFGADYHSSCAHIAVTIGAIGTLAKRQSIDLDRLVLTLASPGEDTLRDTTALSGRGGNVVETTIGDLFAPKPWTLTAITYDRSDSVIHCGSVEFSTIPADTVDVSLNLASRFSMLRVSFTNIPDSATTLSVSVNGAVKAESTFTVSSGLDTVVLAYDYIASAAVGITHDVSLRVWGSFSGVEAVLHAADTTLTVVSGENKVHTITLSWAQKIKQVACGYMHTLILESEGLLWACGLNNVGQLGTGDTVTRRTPVPIMSNVREVVTGYYHTLMIKNDGSLWACGSNVDGACGVDNSVDQWSPVQVMSEVRSVAAGSHTLIAKTDGSLWVCGNNQSGQLGTGEKGPQTSQTTPVRIIESDVQCVAAGHDHSLIVKTDGSLWACGSNNFGQLGLGTTEEQLTPVQVISGGVRCVAAGSSHTIIVKTDGSLLTCGWNHFGQLGTGDHTDRWTPFQIVNGSVRGAAAGGNHTLLIKTDGSLWACGIGVACGIGSREDQPNLVSAITSGTRSVAGGGEHTLIIKTDGSLWGFGSDYKGQLFTGNEPSAYDTPIPLALP